MNLLARAKALAERVEAEATKAQAPVAVCVIVIHGDVVLQQRMNGAPLFSLVLSLRKAYTSAVVGVRTAELDPQVQPGAPLFALLSVDGGRFTAMGGGSTHQGWAATGRWHRCQRRHHRAGHCHRRGLAWLGS